MNMQHTENTHAIDHLAMQVTPKGKLNHQTRQCIAKTLHTVPGALKMLKALNVLVTKLNNSERAWKQAQDYSNIHNNTDSMAEAQKFGSGFGYNNEFMELKSAEHYRQELLAENWESLKTESVDIYPLVIDLASKIIKEHDVKTVLNFGVAYAHIDNELAKKFPETQFIGVDRSALTKFYNEQFFKLPNLHFKAEDIFNVLQSDECKDSLMFHIRTMTCLPPTFATSFYEKLAESGCKHLVMAEQCGISWQTGEPYTFSYNEQPSVMFRNYMYIHNYPALLKAAGYKLTYSTLLKTSHPDPNYRILVITATKVE